MCATSAASLERSSTDSPLAIISAVMKHYCGREIMKYVCLFCLRTLRTGSEPKTAMTSVLQQLADVGVPMWLHDLSRARIQSGE
jgi:hypothetical protein